MPEQDTNRPLLVFHHIPKAGGTTLIGLLANNFPRSRVHCMEGATKWDNFAALQAEVNKKGVHSLDLVMGHYPFSLDGLFPGRRLLYITLLRNPRSRVVSLLNDIARRKSHYLHQRFWELHHAGGMERVLSPEFTGEVSNEMVRYLNPETEARVCQVTEEHLQRALDNLESRFTFAGLTERFDESLLVMGEHIGLNCRYYVRRNTRVEGAALDFSEADLRRIDALNAMDQALYDRAAQIFSISAEKVNGFERKLKRFRSMNKSLGPLIFYACKAWQRLR